MSRWFRHYIGMMRDEKLVRVAAKAAQPVERVLWVWGAILESASEVNDGGRYDFDPDEAAYFLRCDPADVVSILSGLESCGRIVQGVVARWGDRQFDSDSSKERQRRYREKRHDNVGKPKRDCDSDDHVASRDGVVTLQEDREQITDTSSLRSDVTRVSRETSSEFEDQFWPTYPHKVGKRDAEKAFRAARKRADLSVIMAGLRRYIAAKPPDRPWCNPATFLNQDRWGDMPATVTPRGTGPPSSMTNKLLAATAKSTEQLLDDYHAKYEHPPDAGDAGRGQALIAAATGAVSVAGRGR